MKGIILLALMSLAKKNPKDKAQYNAIAYKIIENIWEEKK